MTPDLLLKAVLFAGIGTLAIIAGTIYSAYRIPGSTTRSLLQHAAAGMVLGGLVTDVFEKLISARGVLFGAIGLLVGVAVMLGIRKLAESKPGGSSLAPTILVDITADGGLIGLSVGLRSPTAVVLAVGLAPEIFFLGVTLAEELKGGGKGRLIGLGVLIGGGIAAMGAVGWWLSTGPG